MAAVYRVGTQVRGLMYSRSPGKIEFDWYLILYLGCSVGVLCRLVRGVGSVGNPRTWGQCF